EGQRALTALDPLDDGVGLLLREVALRHLLLHAGDRLRLPGLADLRLRGLQLLDRDAEGAREGRLQFGAARLRLLDGGGPLRVLEGLVGGLQRRPELLDRHTEGLREFFVPVDPDGEAEPETRAALLLLGI